MGCPGGEGIGIRMTIVGFEMGKISGHIDQWNWLGLWLVCEDGCPCYSLRKSILYRKKEGDHRGFISGCL